MSQSMQNSLYQNLPSSKKFSVRKTEKTAVKVATVLRRIATGPLITGDLSFISRLAEISGVSYLRISQMLNGLGTLDNTPTDLLRIALAVISYLPCFDTDDNVADPLYTGKEDFPVHAKVVEAAVEEHRPGVITVYVKLLGISSIFAGRYFLLKLDGYTALALLRKIYSGRGSMPPLIALLNCYFCIPAPLLLKGITRDTVSAVSCSTEEKERNKKLCTARNKGCSHADNCFICLIGRDRCASAIRAKTKVRDEKQEEKGESEGPEPTNTGATVG